MRKIISRVGLGVAIFIIVTIVVFAVMLNHPNNVPQNTAETIKQTPGTEKKPKQNNEASVSVDIDVADSHSESPSEAKLSSPNKSINVSTDENFNIDTDTTNTDTDVYNEAEDESEPDVSTDPHEEISDETPQTSLPLAYIVFDSWQPSNDYPYKDSCSSVVYGYPACQCTAYVAWKAITIHGVLASNWGNSNHWPSAALNNGFVVDNIPAVDSIGVVPNGYYGHLFWVEEVYLDGSIIVSEYNIILPNMKCNTLGFCSRPMTAQEANEYRYIHLDQLLP